MYLAGPDPQVGSRFSTLAEPEPEVWTWTSGVIVLWHLAPSLVWLLLLFPHLLWNHPHCLCWHHQHCCHHNAKPGPVNAAFSACQRVSHHCLLSPQHEMSNHHCHHTVFLQCFPNLRRPSFKFRYYYLAIGSTCIYASLLLLWRAPILIHSLSLILNVTLWNSTCSVTIFSV